MPLDQKYKVFISYHHANDQWYKEYLLAMNAIYDIFIDRSVPVGDIDDKLNDQAIREKIRDEYLADSTVTILLVGKDTWGRKHIDWEIYSSMYDGPVNKKSGILVINLPVTNGQNITAGHGDQEKQLIYPNYTNWFSPNRLEYESMYPFMPARIIDNLITNTSKISVVPWSTIQNNPQRLKQLIEFTNMERGSAIYDLSREMRRSNAILNTAYGTSI